MTRGDLSNVMELTLLSHVGTHVDAPRHFVADGATLTDFSADEFVFSRPMCLDLPLANGDLVSRERLAGHAARLAECDLLLLRTGFFKVRAIDSHRYATQSPGLDACAARFLKEEFPRLRAIGLDTISLACMVHLEEGLEAHRILLGGRNRHFLIFEDMNLSHELAGLCRVIALPLMVTGADGCPCTILGEME
jgi:kynurenine formamidase